MVYLRWITRVPCVQLKRFDKVRIVGLLETAMVTFYNFCIERVSSSPVDMFQDIDGEQIEV